MAYNCTADTFVTAQLLRAAASVILAACNTVEAESEAYDRLEQFPWEGITCSLEEAAVELSAAAEFLEGEQDGL